jgi:hypothetical protein
MNFTALLVLTTFVLALIFLLFGKSIVRHIPSVARFRSSKQYLLIHVRLGYKKIPQGQALSAFCRRESDEVVTWGSSLTEAANLQKMPTGTIVTILHYKEEALNKTIYELRTYSFLILVLGIVGALLHLKESRFEITLDQLMKWIGESPFETVDVLKLVLIAVFSIKLMLEIISIKELFKE